MSGIFSHPPETKMKGFPPPVMAIKIMGTWGFNPAMNGHGYYGYPSFFGMQTHLMLRWSHNCGGSTSSNLECLKLRNRRCWGKKITSVILWPCHGLTWGQPGKNILKEPWNTLKYPEAESILAYLKVVYSGISHIHSDSSSHFPPLSPTISHEFPIILAIHILFMSY